MTCEIPLKIKILHATIAIYHPRLFSKPKVKSASASLLRTVVCMPPLSDSKPEVVISNVSSSSAILQYHLSPLSKPKSKSKEVVVESSNSLGQYVVTKQSQSSRKALLKSEKIANKVS